MCVFFVLLFMSVAEGLDRRLSYTSNPGCESYNFSITYLKAEGPNDTLHYLWDFSRRPTLFLALTENNVNLNVNCEDFAAAVEHSFNFTQKPKYEFSLIFHKLIEFDDVNDTGILTSDSRQISYNTKDFKWEISENLKGDKEKKFVSLSMTGRGYNQSLHFMSGNFTIELTAFGSENHDRELPHLLHSSNSTQCKVELENLKSNSGFNQSRFAVEMILISGDSRNSSSKIVMRKNLDDENSPGVFSMVDVMTPGAQNRQFRGAFLQWRPIVYVSKVPGISNSSEVVVYDLTVVKDFNEAIYNSLPFKYYGFEINNYLIEQTIVSMGMTQDGFYRKTNYSSWTFLVNYGSPEEEKFSLLVILVMCIGLGLPALLVIVGGIYMCATRIRRNKDELSLER